MRVTPRGWAVVFVAAFLFGAYFPWDSMPWAASSAVAAVRPAHDADRR